MRLAKIAGYIIDVVRHYSIDSHTRDLASRARDPRKAQPARQAFSFSSENPFSLGGDSWQSARESLRLRGELLSRRLPQPFLLFAHRAEISRRDFPSPSVRTLRSDIVHLMNRTTMFFCT